MALAAYNMGYGHLLDARRITVMNGGNPDRWVDLKDNLPLLMEQKWYTQVRWGYAHSRETLAYVRNVRNYYDILVWMTEDREEEASPPPRPGAAPITAAERPVPVIGAGAPIPARCRVAQAAIRIHAAVVAPCGAPATVEARGAARPEERLQDLRHSSSMRGLRHGDAVIHRAPPGTSITVRPHRAQVTRAEDEPFDAGMNDRPAHIGHGSTVTYSVVPRQA